MHFAGQRGSRFVSVEAVEARRLMAFTPFGSPTVVSGLTDGVEAMAGNAAGTHVVATTQGGSVFISIFDSSGDALASNLLVNNVGGAQDADVAINGAGDIVVAYTATEPDPNAGQGGNPNTDTLGVYMRRFTSAGVPAGAPELVNTVPDGDQRDARVGIATNGSFVVVYQNEDNGNIEQRRYDAAGNAVTVAPVAIATGTQPDVAVNGSGDYVVTYSTPANTFAQRYDSTGTVQGVAINVVAAGNSNADVGIASDGSFVVAYQQLEAGSGSRFDVLFQRYNAGGTTVGGPTNAATDPEGSEAFPQVDVSGSGQFAVGWLESANGSTFDQIGFRAFDNTATEITDETLIDIQPTSANVAEDNVFDAIYRDGEPVRVAYLSGNSAFVQPFVIPKVLTLNLGNGGGTLDIQGTNTNLVVKLNGTTTNYSLTEYTSFVINGGDGPDSIRIRTTPQPTTITAGGGNDTIRTAEGDDVIDAGEGSDAVTMGDGQDYVYGGGGNDTLFGGADYDILTAGPGRNEVYGEDGDDLLQGGNRADTMFGGAGNDRLRGFAGGDGLFGQDGDDNLLGGTGTDGLVGGAGNDILDGEEGNDTLRGGIGSDDLRGNVGNDLLFGDSGSDALNGGVGFDIAFTDGLDTLFAIERRRVQR